MNTGTHRSRNQYFLFKNLQLTNAVDAEKIDDTVVIEVGGRVTIAGETIKQYDFPFG